MHINRHLIFKSGNLDNVFMKHLVLCIFKTHNESEYRKIGDLSGENNIYALEDLTAMGKLTDFILAESTGAKLLQKMKVTCTGIASSGYYAEVQKTFTYLNS